MVVEWKARLTLYICRTWRSERSVDNFWRGSEFLFFTNFLRVDPVNSLAMSVESRKSRGGGKNCLVTKSSSPEFGCEIGQTTHSTPVRFEVRGEDEKKGEKLSLAALLQLSSFRFSSLPRNWIAPFAFSSRCA